jgi:DNA-binding MarR family transcriptional regulator
MGIARTGYSQVSTTGTSGRMSTARLKVEGIVAKPSHLCQRLDKVFHAKARLGIVTALAGRAQGMRFSDLKTRCGLTDGNLFRHLQVLAGEGCIILAKAHEGHRLRTRCSLTKRGRARFADYLCVLQQVVEQASADVGVDLGIEADVRARPAERTFQMQDDEY